MDIMCCAYLFQPFRLMISLSPTIPSCFFFLDDFIPHSFWPYYNNTRKNKGHRLEIQTGIDKDRYNCSYSMKHHINRAVEHIITMLSLFWKLIMKVHSGRFYKCFLSLICQNPCFLTARIKNNGSVNKLWTNLCTCFKVWHRWRCVKSGKKRTSITHQHVHPPT